MNTRLEEAPQYFSWIRRAALGAVAAYALSFVVRMLGGREPLSHVVTDLIAGGAIAVILLLSRNSPSLKLPTLAILGVVWTEVHYSFFLTGMQQLGLAALPIFVAGVALVAGSRWGIVLALTSSVTTPLCVWASPASPGIAAWPNAPVLLGMLLLMALLMHLAMQSHARVLQQARESAEQLVREREASATKERKLAEQLQASHRLEAVGQLAGGVAHDINNLLQAMFGAVDLLESDIPATSRTSHTVLRELRLAAERCAGLVRQLLTFARKGKTAAEIIDVDESLETIDRMLVRLLPAGVKLSTQFHSDGARVRIDPVQWEQVLVNLVVNARDAMPAGGVIEIASRREPATGLGAAMVVVSVKDAGAGMTEEVRRRAFEPFFTTKGVGKGTGLGLSIVYGIVQEAHGELLVESTPGVGTTLTLKFPTTEEQVTRAEVLEGAAPAHEGETILVIDDEQQVRRTTVRVLQRLGYRVLEASSGEEGIAAARATRVDLIVTDVVMPGMTGPQAMAQILAERPATRVLYVSGYTGDKLSIDEHDPLAFLAKPYSILELAARVRRLIDGPGGPAAGEATDGRPV